MWKPTVKLDSTLPLKHNYNSFYISNNKINTNYISNSSPNTNTNLKPTSKPTSNHIRNIYPKHSTNLTIILTSNLSLIITQTSTCPSILNPNLPQTLTITQISIPIPDSNPEMKYSLKCNSNSESTAKHNLILHHNPFTNLNSTYNPNHNIGTNPISNIIYNPNSKLISNLSLILIIILTLTQTCLKPYP